MKKQHLIPPEVLQEVVDGLSINPQISYALTSALEEENRSSAPIQLIPIGSVVNKWLGRAFADAYAWPATWDYPKPDLLSGDIDLAAIVSVKSNQLEEVLELADAAAERIANKCGLRLCSDARPSRGKFINMNLESVTSITTYLATPSSQRRPLREWGDYFSGHDVPRAAILPFMQHDANLVVIAQDLFHRAAIELRLTQKQKHLVEDEIRDEFFESNSLQPKHLLPHELLTLLQKDYLNNFHLFTEELEKFMDTYNWAVLQKSVTISVFPQTEG